MSAPTRAANQAVGALLRVIRDMLPWFNPWATKLLTFPTPSGEISQRTVYCRCCGQTRAAGHARGCAANRAEAEARKIAGAV